MKEYIKAQIKTNETILADSFSTDELNRFSKSDYRWANNHSKQFRHRTVKKGEIYQFEFGKNYKPEMSYEHRGLVLGVKKKLLYVLPIFSYNPLKHTDIYHPIDHPTSKSDIFLLKKIDFSFINHDSVLKLNDLRTVSVNRILYQQNGIISPSSETFKQIEKLVLQKYFPSFLYAFTNIEKNLTDIKNKQKDYEETLQQLTSENNELKSQIAELTKLIK